MLGTSSTIVLVNDALDVSPDDLHHMIRDSVAL
jgi:hypothetical protein